ncbi:penicillin-binding protein 2 [bacterium]|nr:penicillin-binding protein 2 [bacterium]
MLWGEKQIIQFYTLKIRLFLIVLVLVFFLIFSWLYKMQVVDGDYYAQKAENNFLDVIQVSAKRGNIYDRNGNVLAKNIPAFNLYIIPKFLDSDTIDFIINSIKLTEKQQISLKESLNSKNKESFMLKEHLSSKELALIESRMFRLNGLDIVTESIRHYPNSGIASHIVGYINKITPKEFQEKKDLGYLNDDYIGRTGAEGYLEEYLRGKNGKKIVIRDQSGKIKKDGFLQQLIDKKNKEFPPVEEGNDVYLTIDLDLQKEIDEIFFNVRSGAAVVMDVDTGDILALYSKPTFDPNKIILKDDKNYLREIFKDELQPTLNKAFKQFYPGSVFKLITALAAIDSGTFTEDETVDCKGVEEYGSTSFRCWKRTGHGSVNLKKAMAESCDVYFYRVAKKIGLDEINRYAKMLGVGSNYSDFITDVPSGFVPNEKWYRDRYGRYQKGIALNTSIGQGDVYLSPYKVADLYMTTANLGVKKQINLLDRVLSFDGKMKYERKIVQKTTEISPYSFQKVNKGLYSAINDPSGTAYSFRLNDIMVSGKTGTAQVASKTSDEYEFEIPWELRHHAWFSSFAPSYKPEIVVTVLVEHGGSSSAAVPLGMKIIKAYESLKSKRIHAEFVKEKTKMEAKRETLFYRNLKED